MKFYLHFSDETLDEALVFGCFESIEDAKEEGDALKDIFPYKIFTSDGSIKSVKYLE